MSMTIGPRNLTGPSSVARAAGAAAILIGVLVLAGWTFDVAVLKSLIPGRTAMNPGGSALAFLLAGVSLWVQASEVMTSRRRAVGIACAVVVLLIGLARVGGYLAGWDVGPDQLLFREDLEREALRLGQPNRMAPNTAAAFVLVGLALALLDVETRRGIRPAQLLALMGGLIALLVLIGYAYSATSLIGVQQFIPMALNSAIGFAILSVGILHARPDRGLMAVVTSRGAGGAMARRLLPAAIVIPAAVGWVGWLLVQQGGVGRPGHGAVALRRGEHRDLHGADLVERGVAEPHGPRAPAGGAAPGRPVHGLAASWRSRRSSTTPCPRSWRRSARAWAGKWAPCGGSTRRPACCAAVTCGTRPSSAVEEFVALMPADHLRPRRRPARPRLGERPAGLDPGRRPGRQLPAGSGRGPRGPARRLRLPDRRRQRHPGRHRGLQRRDPAAR